MHLDIEFLDGHLEMEVGAIGRIRVSQEDATGIPHPIGLQKVEFAFKPIAWGRVTPLDEPGVGQLEVVEVVESDDLLLSPTYDLAATLTNHTGRTLRTERRVHLLATAIEVEIGFEVGQGQKFQRFEPKQLKQPIDWSQAEVSDPSCMSIVIRDEKPHLRMTGPQAFPASVTILMPNGERVSMNLTGGLVSHRPDDPVAAPPVVEPTPAAAPAPAPAAETAPPAAAIDRQAETVIESAPPAESHQTETEIEEAEVPTAPSLSAALAEVQALRRYVSSFAGSSQQADDSVASKIRERIEREVERVWELVESTATSERAQLETLFKQATDALPEARRAAQALAG